MPINHRGVTAHCLLTCGEPENCALHLESVIIGGVEEVKTFASYCTHNKIENHTDFSGRIRHPWQKKLVPHLAEYVV